MTEPSPAGVRRVESSRVREIAVHLDRGGLLAYPTETVYGLGSAATSEGVELLRRMKGRSAERPFLALIPDPEDRQLAWTPAARALAEHFWPGPLTLVLRDPTERFPPGVRDEEGRVAVRVSPHPFVRKLARIWPHPLLSTSANRSGGRPAMTADEAAGALAHRPGVDRLWVVEGGRLPPSSPSTLVDCSDSVPVVLRAGAVPVGRLQAVVATIRTRQSNVNTPSSDSAP